MPGRGQSRLPRDFYYSLLVRSIELFAGAGGLALGSELAGFRSSKVVEWDRWACDTIRENQADGFPLVKNWQVEEGDVRQVDWSGLTESVDFVTGGPPCQPFSMGGRARAADDKRDMFPAAAEVIKTLQPKAFLLENVRGLTRSAFANYYQYILLRLTYPENASRPNETWLEHFIRLQAQHTSPHSDGLLMYNVVPTLVNAADYGVPQQRHRVFMIGFRSDLPAEWSFPTQTHSHDALLRAQWIDGSYWDEHEVATSKRPEQPDRLAARVRAIQSGRAEVVGARWRTVRDAISDLPAPTRGGSKVFSNHFFQPGARQYKGHTGSHIDSPAKTLKAGGHGVPGGENMLVDSAGAVRYFTIRESARLQTFPDEYKLHGAWSEAMRQLGNAVPVELARIVTESIADQLRTIRN